MNIARAAKGAASLLMVFGLVALVACQAGPAGTPGTPGAKGDKGDPGAAGAPGPAALAAVGESTDHHVILINDGKDSANDPIIGDVSDPKGGVDVTALFSGGVPPITYTISEQPGASSTFKATISDANVIVVTKRTASNVDPTTDYESGTELTVRATDANRATATKEVEIRTNKAPTVAGTGWNTIIVGTQSETYGSGATARKAKNVVSVDFNQGDAGATITGPANYLFEDGTDGAAARKALTYEISSVSRGTGTGAEYATAEITGTVLTITGLKSTWNKDATPPAHVPLSIKVKATDAGGLSVESTVRIVVDGAPEVGDTAPPAVISRKQTGVLAIVVRDLADFFEDPEGTTVPVTIQGATIAPSVRGAVSIDGDGHLTLTPNNQGAATITFFAQSSGAPLAADNDDYLPNALLDRDANGAADAATTPTAIITQVLKHEIKVTITP